MSKLLHFEMIKVFKRTTFYVCGAFIVILSILGVFIDYLPMYIFSNLDDISELVEYGYCGQKYLLSTVTYANFPVLVGIFVTVNVCKEYSEKTMKNIWSRGYTRTQVYFSKAIVSIMVAAIYFMVSSITGFIIGSLIFGIGNNSMAQIIFSMFAEMIVCIGIGTIVTAVVFAIKKTALSAVAVVAGPSLITIGATILDVILEYKNIDISITEYVPSNALVDVCNSPSETALVAKCLIIGLFYIAISVYLGWMAMRKDQM